MTQTITEHRLVDEGTLPVTRFDTPYTPWENFTVDEAVVAREGITQLEVVAHALDLPLSSLHEVVIEVSVNGPDEVDTDVLMFTEDHTRWSMTTGWTTHEAWKEADLIARMTSLSVRGLRGVHAADTLLGLAAGQCDTLEAVEALTFTEDRPEGLTWKNSLNLRRATIAGILGFWWEREFAAGLDVEGAQMLLALSGQPALIRQAPALLGW